MMRTDVSSLIICWIKRFAMLILIGCTAALAPAWAAVQAEIAVSPDATPQIQQISPNQAVPGARVTVTIQGRNFSLGAYVSSVAAVVHVESSKRVSATQLEAHLSVGASAQPSTVSLLVSNPASRAAEVAFKIVAGTAPAPPPPAVPSPPAAPIGEIKPSVPATPTVRVAPAPEPSVSVSPVVRAVPAGPPGPEVTAVTPPMVGPGNDIDLKVTGRNFTPGAKVSFANPDIRVLGVTSASVTEIVVHIKVARDAAAGATSLYVINPDDREVEVPFQVAGKGALVAVTPTAPTIPTAPIVPTTPTTPIGPVQPVAPAAPVPSAMQRFDAFHLGNPGDVFQTHGRVKGVLVVSSGNLLYQEGDSTLVSMPLNEIKEIKTSSVATNTFHVTLNSGKSYHFAPGSLRPADARSVVDALRKSLAK